MGKEAGGLEDVGRPASSSGQVIDGGGECGGLADEAPRPPFDDVDMTVDLGKAGNRLGGLPGAKGGQAGKPDTGQGLDELWSDAVPWRHQHRQHGGAEQGPEAACARMELVQDAGQWPMQLKLGLGGAGGRMVGVSIAVLEYGHRSPVEPRG